ncbi:hypothetical protein WR25_23811 isoform K [Diploscapter pachys]|uniref:Nudix hydrolase domain-containing protein n=1 Tax=Diploscapter pachys TaxID=2018661 RepID=A0A2A2J7W1_9BILA|nr:hypothetical protein WR25_23811 isoform A [Diploscapter pachys]PAV57858.1 hypothetical protein WR25_23811 isoform E [Diploscapter pachys]PAV57863.1 hypothetical protein WR25_23811 isoform J [Diploscapter pachys]PAV57864.1 hypothetical protein WR25_23811 isoform K [Diploscapter pachys]
MLKIADELAKDSSVPAPVVNSATSADISSTPTALPTECPYQLSDEKVVYTGRWLSTKQVKFRTQSGNEGVWQFSNRTTRPEKSVVDGVDVLAVLKKSGKRYFILVRQWRIPMNGWCLEFPAGLIDENETVEEAALRELREETGYSAKLENIIHKTNGIQGLDPGLTSDSLQFVLIEVDGDAPENATPQQKLDHTEAIDVILVECDKAFEYLKYCFSSFIFYY